MHPYEMSIERRKSELAKLNTEFEILKKQRFNYEAGTQDWKDIDKKISDNVMQSLLYYDFVTVSYQDILDNLPVIVFGKYKGDYRTNFHERHKIVETKQRTRKGEKCREFLCNCKNRKFALIQEKYEGENWLEQVEIDIPFEEAKRLNLLPLSIRRMNKQQGQINDK